MPKELFAYEEIILGKKFAYAATSGEGLDTKELTQYHKTWLHKNLITVLEQPMDLDVQGSSNSTQEVTAGASKFLLRWNFPTMRAVYIALLDGFVKECTRDQVEAMCHKEASFRGFWYESMFFNYYRGGSSILVKYITPGKNEELNSLHLDIRAVLELVETDTQLLTG